MDILLPSEIWSIIFSHMRKITDFVSIAKTCSIFHDVIDKSITIIDDDEFMGSIPIYIFDKWTKLHTVILKNSLLTEEIFNKLMLLKNLEVYIEPETITTIWGQHYFTEKNRTGIHHKLYYRACGGLCCLLCINGKISYS